MKRVNTKIGDVFFIKIDSFNKRYFQYITNDLKQLNSDVIRCFKKVYLLEDSPDLLEVINDEVFFYAHCVTKWGVKLGHWEKAGNIKDVGTFENILFRDTNDYGVMKGQTPVKISDNWYVWKIGDLESTKVGKLEGLNRNAEIGMVINPESIIYRAKTGEYDFPHYPTFK
ncbi:hypothetical protein [uncultured Flavobacterium sp.]|uniref:hypothetical protein n=1 Tax=uncultured Flavobacterium sp. TaxID=165435 RepID=UPI003081A2CB